MRRTDPKKLSEIASEPRLSERLGRGTRLAPRPARVSLRLLPLVVLLADCTSVEQAPAPSAVAQLDRGVFDRCIAPILIRNCSFNACHGNEGFALRVYSVGKLRAPGTPNTYHARVETELSDAEKAA